MLVRAFEVLQQEANRENMSKISDNFIQLSDKNSTIRLSNTVYLFLLAFRCQPLQQVDGMRLLDGPKDLRLLV